MASHPAVAPTAHRFTREEYYRMAETGLFIEKRVELFEAEYRQAGAIYRYSFPPLRTMLKWQRLAE